MKLVSLPSILAWIALTASPAAAQTSAELLEYARQSIASMGGAFDGAFMQGAGRKRVPFVVEAGRNGAMRYHFNQPAQIITLQVGEEPEGDLTEAIRGTDITREDLSLWYLAWPSGDARADRSAGMPFWVVPVTNPTDRGHYSRADIWIHQKTFSLFRVDAYDRSGKLARRLEVEHIRKFGEQHIADRLRISTFDGGRKKSSTFVQLARERS